MPDNKISQMPIGAKVVQLANKVAEGVEKENGAAKKVDNPFAPFEPLLVKDDPAAKGHASSEAGGFIDDGPIAPPRMPAYLGDATDFGAVGTGPGLSAPQGPMLDPAAQDAAPKELSPELRAQTLELKAAIDNIRSMLGQGAVTELMAELPKAALDALEQLTPNLPLAPGEHPLMAFKKKYAELLKADATIHERARAFHSAAQKFGYHDGSGVDDYGKYADWAQQYSTANEFMARFNRDPQYYYRSSVEKLREANQQIRNAWPDAPAEVLLKGPHDPNGPGLTASQLYRQVMGSGRYSSDAVLTPERLRAMDPAYQQLRRDVLALQEHLKTEMLPTPDQVTAMKAQMLGDDVPMAALFEEVSTLIGKIESMANSSEIKRETLNSTAEGESHGTSSGISVSHSRDGSHPLFSRETGVTVTHSSGSSHGTSKSSGTSQVLNTSAKNYKVIEVQTGQDNRASQLDGKNYVSSFELTLLMDRMLAARRIYEGMKSREPDSPYTRALRGWMEESTVELIQLSGKGNLRIEGMKELEIATVKLGDLRPGILDLANRGFYPEDRVDLLKEELTLGPVHKQSALGLSL